LAGALLGALLLAGPAESTGPTAHASAGKRADFFDLGGGATLVVRRGSVPSGVRVEATRPHRRAVRPGIGARPVGKPVRIAVRGGKLRKRARVTFRVPGRKALRVAGSPIYRVARYLPRAKRWLPLPTKLDPKRRTASVGFLGSASLSLLVFRRSRAVMETLASWIVRSTGLRGPAADCSARGTSPAWAELSTSNYEHDVIRSCGGSEGDVAVVEFVNNRPYGVLLEYGAPVSWGWADNGFGLTQASVNGGRLSDVLGTDGLYVPPTKRASVGIPKGSWTTATFTAQTTYQTMVFDLLDAVLGSGKAYRALGVVEGRCASELLAAGGSFDGAPDSVAEFASALRTVLPAVVDCAPGLAKEVGVSGPREAVLKAARQLLATVELTRLAITVAEYFGPLDGTRTFTAQAKPTAAPAQDPPPSQPAGTTPPSQPAKNPPTTTPTPAKSVSLAKGASAQGLSGCSSSYCRFMVVSFNNFSSGSHSITCRASNGDEGGFYTYTRSGPSNTSAYCYYGFPGRTVWVTVDGISSNKITW
jgi:hypothetical protein